MSNFDLNKTRVFGIVLIIAAIVIVAAAAFYSSTKSQESLVFSNNAMLSSLWKSYKDQYLEKDTSRTLDKQRDYVTTSEGESYTMMRAVLMDDRTTFDNSLNWTKNNLLRKDDHLFSWLFGKKADGSYGILTDQGGQNSASDADVDICLALLFAHTRWQDESYLGDAIVLMHDIWDKEVVVINGKPVLAANNLEKTSTSDDIVVNPSYFAPYAFKEFAKVDPGQDWKGLADYSYEVINLTLDLPLDKTFSAGLPPDWITINRKTNLIQAVANHPDYTTNYSYDAMRLPWRLAVDWEWNQDSRAKDTLSKMTFLGNEYTNHKSLYSIYGHDGKVLGAYESPSIYGGSIGYFIVTDQNQADEVFKAKLQSLYNANSLNWKNTLSYYDDNWAWFGMALYTGVFKNLSQNIK